MRTVQGCWIARLLIVASFGLLVIVGPWSTTAQAQYWPCGCSYCPAGPVQGVVPGLPPEGTEESPARATPTINAAKLKIRPTAVIP